jgi:hypothetical protein
MHLELVGTKDREFPAVEHPARYQSAKIWHCNFRSLARLGEFSSLRDLEIATFPDESFEMLSGLDRLRRLRIIHLPRVSSLEPLRRLSELRELGLSTLASWDASNKRTTIESLHPLEHLHNLETLELTGIVVSDDGLSPLCGLSGLRSLRIGNYFSIQDLAALRSSNPDVECPFLTPTIELSFSKCSRCGSSRVMLSGVPKYNVKCPRCHAKRVSRHLAAWRIAERAAAR